MKVTFGSLYRIPQKSMDNLSQKQYLNYYMSAMTMFDENKPDEFCKNGHIYQNVDDSCDKDYEKVCKKCGLKAEKIEV